MSSRKFLLGNVVMGVSPDDLDPSAAPRIEKPVGDGRGDAREPLDDRDRFAERAYHRAAVPRLRAAPFDEPADARVDGARRRDRERATPRQVLDARVAR